jgi:hypothetical protein
MSPFPHCPAHLHGVVTPARGVVGISVGRGALLPRPDLPGPAGGWDMAGRRFEVPRLDGKVQNPADNMARSPVYASMDETHKCQSGRCSSGTLARGLAGRDECDEQVLHGGPDPLEHLAGIHNQDPGPWRTWPS